MIWGWNHLSTDGILGVDNKSVIMPTYIQWCTSLFDGIELSRSAPDMDDSSTPENPYKDAGESVIWRGCMDEAWNDH